jgi:hypothetical protein
MKLLDKFRAQPEWQSDDPTVRAAAVREISNDDAAQEILIDIARHDDDAGVRREAVIRIDDVGALVDVSADEDPMVRTEAQRVIRELLIESEDREAGEVGLAGLSDERDLVAVARSARLESVSRMALAKLSDPGALGRVARRSTRGAIAKEALSRLDAPEELLAVALKTEDKAIAVRAFERLANGHLSRDALEQLGRQAKQKAVRRRAAAALSAVDEATELPGPSDEHVRVCEAVERVASETDLQRGRERLDAGVRQWSVIDEPPDDRMAERFARARGTAEERLVQLEASALAARESRQQADQALTSREALCRRLEAQQDVATPEAIRRTREEWAALAAVTGDSASVAAALALEQRLEQAIVGIEDRRQELVALEARLQPLDRIVREMERLLEPGESFAEARWDELDRELDMELGQVNHQLPSGSTSSGREGDGSSAMQALQKRYDTVRARRRALLAEATNERDRAQQENLARVLQRCRTVDGLIGSDKLRLGEAERQLRAVRRVLDEPGPLPRQARESAMRKLREAHAGLLGRVRELRDFSDWQRWANLGIQEDLCRKMEALAESIDSPEAAADDATLAEQFLDLMARWRQASDVPKDRGAELLKRFKAAHDVVFPRCQKHFEAEETARERNLARQRAIVDEAERLAPSSDWIKTIQAITALQEEWKALKPVPRTEQRELWKRFRAACNSFFARRKADLADRKKEWARNLGLKEALCDQIEALATAEDLSAAVAQTRQAQKEWKSIGSVRRNRSDAVWKRFGAACDQVLERVHAKERAAAIERAGVREALCVEVEALSSGSDTPPQELATTIRDLQRRWREAPEVPHRLGKELADRFSRGIASLVEAYPDAFRGTDLDPARKRKRLEKLCDRIEGLKSPGTLGQGGASPSEILAARLREALASNLMGDRVDAAAERRAAVEEVRRAQAECHRLGNLVGDEGRELLSRFRKACAQVMTWAEPKKRARNDRPASKPSKKASLASGK